MHTTQNTLRFGQPLSKARGALILIHGRGASAEDIAGLAESLNVQDFALLAPEAENNTWYPQRFFAPLAQNEPWLTGALATVEGLAEEAITAGLRPEQIGVVGFSQGACLAVEHLVRSGRRYGFVGALSGALIGPAGTPRPTRDLSGTPVLLGCAEFDPHIPREYVEQTAIDLTAMKADVTKQIYRGGAHTVFPQEVTWLNEQLARMSPVAR